MTAIFIFIHTIICVLLVIAILMQSGKGGGLTEGFASAESMLGAQTNTFMTKLTAVLATLFVATSLTLAFLSSKKDKSLMEEANYTAPVSDESAGLNEEVLDAETEDIGQTTSEISKDVVETVENVAEEVVETMETVEQTVTETVTQMKTKESTTTVEESVSSVSEE